MTQTQLETAATTGPTRTGIHIQHLTHRYGNTTALADVSLNWGYGQVHGLLGANGSGKTTLMACVCNHIFHTSGSILIDHEDPAERASVLEQLIFVHEDQAYSDAMTNAQIMRAAAGCYPEWDQTLAEELLDSFELLPNAKPVKQSRGQRSMFAATLSLASGAPYTFLDEPTLGMDPRSRAKFYRHFTAEITRRQRTYIMSTHLVDEAKDLFETVSVLNRGHLVLNSEMDDLTQQAFTVRGLADPVRKLAGDRAVISEDRLGGTLVVTLGGAPSAADKETAKQERLSIEPVSLQQMVASLSEEVGNDAKDDHALRN